MNDYAAPTGGAEILIRNLRDGLLERGHEARLLASRAGAGGSPETVDFSCDGSLRGRRTPLQVFNPSARRAIRGAIRDLRPDVVHVGIFLTQLSPSILAPLRNLPALLHVQWYRPICPLGTKRLPGGLACQEPWGTACLRHRCLGAHEWAPLMLQRMLWEGSRDVFDLFVAPSNGVKARIEQAGLAPVEVVPGGVPASTGPKAGVAVEPHTIGFAGRLVAEKGVGPLLEAFEILARREPRARLVLVGDGPERPAIERRVAASGLGGRVEITGWLGWEEADLRLGGAAVQAVPSLWEEPFGLVAAEAMMRGTPLVASEVGGLAEMIEPGRTGVLVPPGEPEALAAALLTILEDRQAAGGLARAARTAAQERYRLGAFVDRMIGIYRRLAGG